MNTTELKAAESALETALEQVRQLIASEPGPKPEKKRMIGVPLTVAPEVGAAYWTLAPSGIVLREKWTDHVFDRERLARGIAFASERDAEYKAAFDEIWGQPIGEWEPEDVYWCISHRNNIYRSSAYASDFAGVHRLWRKGEIGFGDAGKAELERRLAEQKALDARFGL